MKNIYLLLIACCVSSVVAAQGRYGDRDDARIIIIRDVQRDVHRNVIRPVNTNVNRGYWRGFGRDISRELRANGGHRDERARGLRSVYRYDVGSMHQEMRNGLRNEIGRGMRQMRNAIRHSVRGAYRWGRHY